VSDISDAVNLNLCEAESRPEGLLFGTVRKLEGDGSVCSSECRRGSSCCDDTMSAARKMLYIHAMEFTVGT
jgi:hypothetical protein